MSIKALRTENLHRTILDQSGSVLLLFGTKTSVPCQIIRPTLEELAQEFPKVSVFQVDVDKDPHAAQEFGVKKVPSTFIVKNGIPTKAFTGIRPKSTILEYLDL